MASEVVNVAQNMVRDWATLNADVVFLDHLNQLGMLGQVETVTDSLSAEKDSIEQFSVVATDTLASVKDQVELFAESLLCLVDDSEHILEFGVVVLLHDSVKSSNHVTEAIILSAEVNHLLEVIAAEYLQRTHDDAQAELRESDSKSSLYTFKDSHLSLNREGTIFIEKHSENMAILNDRNKLLDIVLANSEKASLKEMSVVDKFVSQVELGLEGLPNEMVFALVKIQEDVLFKFLIKDFAILSVRSQGIHFNIAGLGASTVVDMVLVLFFRVVHEVVISQF